MCKNKKNIFVDKDVLNKEQYVNKTFNRITIHDVKYGYFEGSNRIRRFGLVSCMCSPENKYIIDIGGVIYGEIKSCGCIRKENNSKMKDKCRNPSKYLDRIFKTNEGYFVKIISLKTLKEVTVRFIDVEYDYEFTTTFQNIKNGEIKYPYHKNKYGCFYGVGSYAARSNGKKTVAYNRWVQIQKRAYNHSGIHPSYVNTELCDEWKNFQNFAKWFEENSYESSMELDVDKDLISLLTGKKIYSPDTCFIIPHKLNISIKNITNFSKYELKLLVSNYIDAMPYHLYNKILDIIEKSSIIQ